MSTPTIPRGFLGRVPALATAASLLCFLACGGGGSSASTSTGPKGPSASLLAGGSGGPGWLDGPRASARFDSPWKAVEDATGTVYVADSVNHVIRKISPTGEVSTLAGQPGVAGAIDGTGAAARFNRPMCLAVDGSGTVYVTELNNHAVRKINPSGVVTTLAGSMAEAGAVNGTGSAARFRSLRDVVVDAAGSLYVADPGSHTIRKVTPEGVVTTFAGSLDAAGAIDGTLAESRFKGPHGLSLVGKSGLVVADTFNHVIRYIDLESGIVGTAAGQAGASGSTDGSGSAARFSLPQGVASDGAGHYLIGDYGNATLRWMALGVVSTLAGAAGQHGSIDGTGGGARFESPLFISHRASGDFLVADPANHEIRTVTAGGVVASFAGHPAQPGSEDGVGSAARFRTPWDVAVGPDGMAYVADTNNQVIRKIAPDGTTTVLAGAVGVPGTTDGTGSGARFWSPIALTVDTAGNAYVLDFGGQILRKITPAGVVTTLAGSPGTAGSADGTGSAARFNLPSGLAVDGGGTLYVADTGNHTIRKVSPAGVVTTLAGQAGQVGTADGTGSAARFNNPRGVVVDATGKVFVLDTGNHTIRAITTGGGVSTLAGSPGQDGWVEGSGSAARFKDPQRGVLDGAGNLYVTDVSNHAIRKVTPTGRVSTAAGGASRGMRLGNAPAFNAPAGLGRMPGAGHTTLVVSDIEEHCVVKVLLP